MENQADVLVIGAGAAGLMAAADLSKAAKKVVVLEARPEPGGRILARELPGLPTPVQLGAEFIHGQLPLTLHLFQAAGAEVANMSGETYEFRNGKLRSDPGIVPWPEFERTLSALDEDISVDQFLQRYFRDHRYEALRSSVRGFVEGYDAADPAVASMLALKEEWKHEAVNLTSPNGYLPLIEVLINTCKAGGVRFMFSSVVKQVQWTAGYVEITTETGTKFSGRTALITVPVGVLASHHPTRGAISFVPPIPDKIQAAREIGFGSVIKFALKFYTPFWKDIVPNLGFIVSDLSVPTWWPQGRQDNPVLVGWLAGPSAREFKGVPEKVLLSHALSALGQIFGKDEPYLQQQLQSFRIHNWSEDPFAAGAYSYTLTGHFRAREALGEPLENTLFFAGEAVYQGPAGGTVEAALHSGSQAARQVLGHLTQQEKTEHFDCKF